MLNETNKNFAENLKKLMKEKDLSYRVLSRATGISVGSLHGYAHCKTSIPLPNAKLIATYFDTTIDFMIEGEEDEDRLMQKKIAQ